MMGLSGWLLGNDPAESLAADMPNDAVTDQTDPACISEDWVVVVEDLSSVRTIELGDVLQQRVRNRPKLARWDATEDMLIEHPLEGPRNKTSPPTYAWIARPSYAQAFKMARKAGSRSAQKAGSSNHSATWIQARSPPTAPLSALAAAEIEERYGSGSSDAAMWCPGTRVMRRLNSRVNQVSFRGTRVVRGKPRNVKPREKVT